MSAPKRIQELVERFETHFKQYQSIDYNEEDLRHEFLNPFFEELGWDMANVGGKGAHRDVHYEKRIKSGAPDFGFYLDGKTKFFVEAKNPSKNVCNDAVAALQLRRYGWSANVPRSVLTDFEEFSIYDTTVRPKDADGARIARLECIKYTELSDRWDEIAALFSRQAIIGGSLEKLEKKRAKQAVDDELLDDISRWRETLAKNIALRNSELTEEQVNRAVQDTLDRIIFLRICEDRGIEQEGRLKEAVEETGAYESLFRLFKKAEKRYDSGLFDLKAQDGLAVDDRALKEIISELYFPKSPYNFAAIPAEILGQVYEQFLGKVIRLTEGHHAKVEEKPEVRKAGGVYYTPSYIVEYIVKNTVGELVEGKRPKDIETLSVLDPACGSGSFLIGAYQYLMDWYRDWYVEHDAEKWKKAKKIYRDKADLWQITLAERTRILLAHIYGVDIDRQAVEVAKLSLMLKALEAPEQQSLFDDRILPDLSSNIKCGNSLIASDFSMISDDLLRVHAFDWPVQFSPIMKASGFHAVIGNPPYIRIQGFPEDQIAYFGNNYHSATGSYDIYVNFVERGLSLLSEAGVLGMILPNKFFRTDYGVGLRGLLAEKHAVTKIVDFGAAQVFDATTYTSLLFLGQNQNQTFKYATSEADEKILSALSFEQRKTDSLTSDPWTFADKKQLRLLEKVKMISTRLLDLPADMSRGSSSGDDEVFVVEAADHGLEESILRTPLFASDFGRYHFAPQEKWRIIFPYIAGKNGFRLMSSSELQEKFPKAFAYLQQNVDRLKARKQFKEWFGYSAPRNLELHDRAQIAVPLLADRGLFAPIPKSYLGSLCPMASGGFTIALGVECNLKTEFVLGILNSKLVFWFLRQISNVFRGGWVTCTKQYFGELPIIRLDLENPAEKERHDKLVGFVDKILGLMTNLHATTSDSEKTTLQNVVATTDHQIDQLVYRLYGLTEEEIRIVEEGTK